MSNWKKSPFRSQTSLRDRYPIEQNLLDPWAGDECFYPIEDHDFAQAVHDNDLLKQYITTAKQKGYSRIPKHDDYQLLKAEYLCPLSYLANITEDWVPDIGMFAQERVLGPFAPFNHFRVLCGAILCFSPLLKHGITPAGRFSDTQKSIYSVVIGIQAKSPCMIWKQDGNGHVIPLLPIAPQYIPKDPVQNIPKEQYFIGRICPTIHGWITCCALPIPVVETQYITNMISMEWLKLQQSNALMFWEDVLRYRGELIYRSALEYCFIHAYQETIQCWDSFLLDVQVEN